MVRERDRGWTIRSTESVPVRFASSTQSLFATANRSPRASMRSTPIDRMSASRIANWLSPNSRNDCGHFFAHLDVLLPFALKRAQYFALGFRVHDVNADWLGLTEAVHAVNGLNKVVELEADAGKDLAVAMALEIAARSGDDRFSRQDRVTAVAEVDDALFALVQILRTPDAHRARNNRLDLVPLVFEVVPDNEMIVRAFCNDLGGFSQLARRGCRVFRLPLPTTPLQRRGSISPDPSCRRLPRSSRSTLRDIEHPDPGGCSRHRRGPKSQGTLNEYRPKLATHTARIPVPCAGRASGSRLSRCRAGRSALEPGHCPSTPRNAA